MKSLKEPSQGPASAGEDPSQHACCVVFRAVGILLCGRPGAGKSTLSDAIIFHGRNHGHYAAHVGDDQVLISLSHGRLVAAPPPKIAGRWEKYGIGIVKIPYQPKAVLHLVCELTPQREIIRFAQEGAEYSAIKSVRLSRLILPENATEISLMRICERVEQICYERMNDMREGGRSVLSRGPGNIAHQS